MNRSSMYDSSNIYDMMKEPSRVPQNSQFSQFDPPPGFADNVILTTEEIREQVEEKAQQIEKAHLCVKIFGYCFAFFSIILCILMILDFFKVKINNNLIASFIVLAVFFGFGLTFSGIAYVIILNLKKPDINEISPPNINVVTTSDINSDRINQGDDRVNTVLSQSNPGMITVTTP